MLNAEQIRVARALLDWSTAELARFTGLTVNGINKIERGHVHPQRETLHKIQKVFEEAGLVFSARSGVQKKEEIIMIWSGRSAYGRLLEDVLENQRGGDGELLIFGIDEDILLDRVGEERVRRYFLHFLENDIHPKFLTHEKTRTFILPPEHYHTLPQKYFPQDPIIIYGSKLVLVWWEDPGKVVTINDARLADSVRRMFSFVWNNTEPAMKLLRP